MSQKKITAQSNGNSVLSDVALIIFIHFNADFGLISEC
jgi:hypothetical protein